MTTVFGLFNKNQIIPLGYSNAKFNDWKVTHTVNDPQQQLFYDLFIYYCANRLQLCIYVVCHVLNSTTRLLKSLFCNQGKLQLV